MTVHDTVHGFIVEREVPLPAGCSNVPDEARKDRLRAGMDKQRGRK